jgi:Zn-dependent M32 family carboxypeptidase
MQEISAAIAGHRARAEQARRLASQVNDALTHHSLLKHADQHEHEADELEVQLMVLREMAQSEPGQPEAA